MNIMSKSKKDIAAAVAEQMEMSRKDAETAVNAVFEAISETLSDGGEVTISGFGKFSFTERAARRGINPHTGEQIDIPASRSLKFKASKTLKDRIG